jgi:hypothetical protein
MWIGRLSLKRERRFNFKSMLCDCACVCASASAILCAVFDLETDVRVEGETKGFHPQLVQNHAQK